MNVGERHDSLSCAEFFNIFARAYSLPSCENTLRLKLLWLSAIVTSPAPLMPTPIG